MDDTKAEKAKEQPSAFNFNKSFETDQGLETDGAWDEIYMDGQTLEVLVARANNTNYRKLMRGYLLKYKRKLEREDERTVQLFETLSIQAMAKTILLGWKGLSVNNKPFEYSTENAEYVLGNADFRAKITEISDSFDLYKTQSDEKIKGN